MPIFLSIFIRGFRGPYGQGLVGHCTSDHSLNPPLGVTKVSQTGGSSSVADAVRARLEDPDHRRRRIARAKERRAFLVLGIVMASFVGCWLPFFFVYLVTSLAGPRVPQPPPMLFAVIFWLGYCNSALNPIIYTIFNRDFRRAFRKILCGRPVVRY